MAGFHCCRRFIDPIPVSQFGIARQVPSIVIGPARRTHIPMRQLVSAENQSHYELLVIVAVAIQ